MAKVLFFAQLREQLACDQVDLSLEQPASLEDIKARLVADHPHWQPFLQQRQLLSAVNQTLVGPDTLVEGGDEVAFFPPVTGG